MALLVLNCDMGVSKSAGARGSAIDEQRMSEVIAFTAKTLATARPVPFWRSHRPHRDRRNPAEGGERRLDRERPQFPRRVEGGPAGLQEAETVVAGGLHDVFHLRTVRDVHGERIVGEARPGGLRSDDSGRQQALPADTHPREGRLRSVATCRASLTVRCCEKRVTQSLPIPTC